MRALVKRHHGCLWSINYGFNSRTRAWDCQGFDDEENETAYMPGTHVRQ